MIQLSEASRNSWRANRYVVLRGALDGPECERLRKWTEELAAWLETPGKWMKYFEPGPARLLCRVENFLPYHAGLRALLERGDLQSCLEELMGEPPVLFKEKLNFKLPGGGGFAPHQD
ncbi:MAG TPA: phytanoyl-CoA dioxygenase family protein, partial [Myxococcota bacterium]|nr:phytanoyl-CoA dioxygenase family protein [Myxococcota bacterium]